MTSLRWAQVLLSLLALIVVGCAPTEINVSKKSSYADLVVIHNSEFPEELKRKLSELDAEIAKQKERVDRARNARDAEEAK